MSNFETTPPIPPRPATRRELLEQLDRMRRNLERLVGQAQRAAAEQAARRAQQLQREQTRKIQKSIDALDEKTRRSIDSLDRRHREQLERVTRRVYEDMEKGQLQLAERTDRQLTALASDVAERINGLEKRTQHQFERQQREIRSINERMDVIVKEIDSRFEQDEREIIEIQQDLRSIHQRFQDEENLARETVNAARALLDVVEERTMLDRFAPGYEAQDIRDRVRRLDGTELTGAALTAKAEEAITSIMQTERHAVQEKAKHDALVEVALSQIERVLTVVNDNRVIERPVENGEPITVENEFWSEGEYGRLEEELDRLKAELEDRYNRDLTVERIREIVRRSAEIEDRILQINVESVTKSILSEVRVETMEDIVNAMEKKGWTLKSIDGVPECNYMGGEIDHDWRQGVCAVLENNVGDEITVIIDPVADSHNRLIVHQEASREGQADKEVQERMQAIKEEMCDLGYEVGTPTPGEAHMPEMGSMERLGKAHASEHIREKITKEK